MALTGLQFGKRTTGTLNARIYGKSKEMIKSGADYSKEIRGEAFDRVQRYIESNSRWLEVRFTSSNSMIRMRYSMRPAHSGRIREVVVSHTVLPATIRGHGGPNRPNRRT